jgi:hypothetical protein
LNCTKTKRQPPKGRRSPERGSCSGENRPMAKRRFLSGNLEINPTKTIQNSIIMMLKLKYVLILEQDLI